ncbi:LamG domain-containing protein [Candidatus Poribacteria bacterium]
MSKRRFYISLLMVVVIALPIWKAMAAEPEGLVLYLSFEEQDPVDHSTNPANVSIRGALKQVNGKFGRAMEFDGNAANYIEVDHSDKLEGMSALTIEVWVNPTSPDVNARAIVSKRTAFQNDDIYNLFSWNEVKMWARVNANEAQQVGSETILDDGTWYHFAYIFNGGAPEDERQKLYVDGVLEAENSHPDESVGKSGQPLWIGILNAGYAQSWNGMMDELRIWDKALSEGEITLARQGKINPVEPRAKLATTWGDIKG